MRSQSSVSTKVGATEARSHFADLLKRVHASREHLIVEKGGIPVAAIIGMREYEDFLRWRAQEELRLLGMSMADRAQRAGIDEEKLVRSLQEDRRAIYASHYNNDQADA